MDSEDFDLLNSELHPKSMRKNKSFSLGKYKPKTALNSTRENDHINRQEKNQEFSNNIFWKECKKIQHKSEFKNSNEERKCNKDIFLNTDEESLQSLDMNEVVSFNMERKYANVMEKCSQLNILKDKLKNLQTKLSKRTTALLSGEVVQQQLKFYKIERMGLKSKYDKKKDELQQQSNMKGAALFKISNKNKMLVLEKLVILKLLKNKGKKDKSLDYKNVVEILE